MRLSNPLFLLACLVPAILLPANDSVTVWTMLDVCPRLGQADCHVLRLPDGRNVLIDAGEGWDAPGAALAGLRAQGIDHISLAVISHFHQDHYGRLLDLLDAGIQIDRVVVNVPRREVADQERPWGCDWNDVQRVLAVLAERHVAVEKAVAGAQLIDTLDATGAPVRLEVLCAYDGVETPVGVTDVNDTTILLRFTHGNTRALFTGDLNAKLGGYLARGAADLRADLLKAPHHGTEGTVPDEFYAAVNPHTVLVPAPKALWESARSMRMRNYFLGHQMPVYVSGMRGVVNVILSATGFTVSAAR